MQVDLLVDGLNGVFTFGSRPYLSVNLQEASITKVYEKSMHISPIDGHGGFFPGIVEIIPLIQLDGNHTLPWRTFIFSQICGTGSW